MAYNNKLLMFRLEFYYRNFNHGAPSDAQPDNYKMQAPDPVSYKDINKETFFFAF